MDHRTVHYETSQLKMSSTNCTLLSALLTTRQFTAHMVCCSLSQGQCQDAGPGPCSETTAANSRQQHHRSIARDSLHRDDNL